MSSLGDETDHRHSVQNFTSATMTSQFNYLSAI